jgi:hypothetical protein
LVTEFTEHLQIVTTSNYSAIANSHALQFTTAYTKSSQSVSSPVDVFLLPGSRPRRLAAISHQPPSLLTAVSRLPCNGSWFSLYSLGTDRTENTASNSYSTVALHNRYLAMAVSLAPQFLLSKYATISTPVSRLPCNGSWFSLYSLGTDRTENIASNSYSTVALHNRYLAMAVSLAPQFLLSKYATISMPREGFEPAIQMFECFNIKRPLQYLLLKYILRVASSERTIRECFIGYFRT